MKAVLLGLVWVAGMACGQSEVGAEAAAPASTNMTVITSDRLEFDYPRSVAVFTGNVLVMDKDMRMWADQMTVILSSTDEIESVTAVGRVRITQPGRSARCRKAIFLVDQHEVILTGDAVLQRGRDRVEGRVIRIWTDSDRMVSEPGRLLLYPRDGT